MTHRLNPTSHGVASHISHRTRLRVPHGYRKAAHLDKLDRALKSVPGVKDVHINHKTGSILVHHEEHAEIFDRISSALNETAPELLTALIEPEVAVPELVMTFVRNLVSGEPPAHERSKGPAFVTAAEGSSKVKQFVPLAFLSLGFIKLIEHESLFGTTAPLVLFYYAFDTYWKFNQEDASWRFRERMLEEQPPAASKPKGISAAKSAPASEQ